MYKNQLQELAQRSCFNLPSYTCIREGPDHAPRFKATVNFNGEIFESPQYCSTLRQAEHSAAEVALNSLSNRAPSHSLAARILVSFSLHRCLFSSVCEITELSLLCELCRFAFVCCAMLFVCSGMVWFLNLRLLVNFEANLCNCYYWKSIL